MRQISALLMLAATIAACGDSSSPATITVNGKLIDANGYSVGDALVSVNGAPVSAAGGTFSLAGVTTPYNVIVVRQASKIALLFQGLTRSDPTLQYPYAVQFYDRSALVRGTISGGVGFPQPSDHRTQVVVDVPQPGGEGMVSDDGIYAVSRHWHGSSTLTANVRVLQWRVDGNGLPTAYTGYGSRSDLTLTNGASISGQDITLSPVTSAAFAGTVAVPSGLTLSFKSLFLTPATGVEDFSLGHDATGAATFSFVTPDIVGSKLTFAVSAGNGGDTYCGVWKTGLAVNASGLNITVPAPPAFSLPAAGGTGITKTTSFTWTPFSGGVHLVTFQGPADQPSFAVLTAASSATIPDVSSFGLDLPRSAEYRWTLYGLQLKSVDEASGASGYVQGVLRFSSVDAAACVVGPRIVTTAP